MAADEITLGDGAALAPAVPSERNSRNWLESPWFWLAILQVMAFIVPLLPLQSALEATVIVVANTVLHVVAIVQFAALLSRRDWTPAKAAIGLIVALFVWYLLMFETKPYLEHLIRTAPDMLPQLKLIGLLNASTRSTALIVAAVSGGSLVAQLIKSPNLLGPVCALVALIDIWGVLFQGPVSQIMQRAPQIAEKAMNALPTASATVMIHGHRGTLQIPAPAIGAGDYLFIGLLFAALHLNGMNWRGAIKWTIPLVTVALLAVMFLPHVNLPGLLFIGLGIAIPNIQYFEYTREEKFAMLYAAGFVLILTVLIYLGVIRALPHGPMR